MTDQYMKIAQSPLGAKVLNVLGLPIPAKINRATAEHELIVSPILLASPTGEAENLIAFKDTLPEIDISTCASSDDTFKGMIFDARTIKNSNELKSLYCFFHQHVKKIAVSGKIVLIGLDPKFSDSSQQATAQRGLVGFIKALAKEVGRKGVTVNIIFEQSGVNRRECSHIASALRFFLSYRSAYVNGQTVLISASQINATIVQNSWQQPLLGKVALVTGASRGIGAAIATTLARDGAQVIGLDIPHAQPALNSLMQKISGRTLITNITDARAPNDIVEKLTDLVGQIDIVVHNAGITRDRILSSMPESSWEQVIDVNLSSIERINDSLLAHDKINRGGRIICVSSISGIAGNVGQTNYATSKASIIGMIEALAPKLQEKEITINAVAPGFIETQMTASIPLLTRFVGRRACALSQGGLPIDVAETISFIAAPKSQSISANLIRVCGLNVMGA